jgi:hypothetical protein
VGERPDWIKEIANMPFEPQVFRASIAQSFTRATGIARLALSFPIAVLIWATFEYVGLSSRFFAINLLLYFWIAFLLASAIVAWIRPTYIRIVPGRLDVMQFSGLSWRAVRTSSWDLARARVLIDSRRGVAFVDDADESLEFSLRLMRERQGFARALFMAALSTHPPAPLPADELLG